MNKGQRAGDSALAIEVEQGKSYYWCSCGKSSKRHFVMVRIKEQNLNLWLIKLN